MITRRGLLAGLGAPALAAAARGYAPVFAGQVYVWSQYLSREKKPLADNFAQVLKSYADAGYTAVELMPEYFQPQFAERTAGLLREWKLKAPIVYGGGAMHTPAAAEKTIRVTAELARRVKKSCGSLHAINFNPDPLPGGALKSDAQLKTQASALNTLAVELGRDGTHLFLHQHDAEMKEGAREWRYMLANTDPATVRVCLDIHWVFRGGMDVMTVLHEAAPRLASLHLRNSKNGVWMEDLGAGDVDYPSIARYLREEDFRGFLVVELAWDKQTEITRPLESSLRRSLEYAKEVFNK